MTLNPDSHCFTNFPRPTPDSRPTVEFLAHFLRKQSEQLRFCWLHAGCFQERTFMFRPIAKSVFHFQAGARDQRENRMRKGKVAGLVTQSGEERREGVVPCAPRYLGRRVKVLANSPLAPDRKPTGVWNHGFVRHKFDIKVRRAHPGQHCKHRIV